MVVSYPCFYLCISLKDGALEDETYGCKFLHALRWLNLKIGEKDDNHRNNHQGRVTCYIPSESNIISIYHFHCSENIQKMFWKTFYDIKLQFEKNHHLRKITCSRINPNGLMRYSWCSRTGAAALTVIICLTTDLMKSRSCVKIIVSLWNLTVALSQSSVLWPMVRSSPNHFQNLILFNWNITKKSQCRLHLNTNTMDFVPHFIIYLTNPWQTKSCICNNPHRETTYLECHTIQVSLYSLLRKAIGCVVCHICSDLNGKHMYITCQV